jgi:signal transduction histidine kinase
VRRWLAFSPDRPWRAARLILVSIGLAVGVAAERAAYGWDDPRHWIPDLVVGLAYIGAAVVTLPRRPGVGWLLAATGLAWFVGNFDSALQYIHRGPLVHALVVFVGWRVRTRIELMAVVVGYAAAVAAPIWRHELASVVLAVALVAVAGHRWATGTGRARGDRRTALAASAVFAGSVVAYVCVTGVVPSGDAVEPMLLAYQVALCVVAVMLAVRLVAPSASAVADLVVELGESRSGTLRDGLADALGDPTLEIAYWSPTDGYRDMAGRPIAVPSGGGDRAATYVERESQPFAVIIHDASVLGEPALVEAVAAATRLSAANAALTAEVRAQIGEVAASRRRLVIAADEERRRLERRLHDGVKRCLTELTDRLGGLSSAGGGGEHLGRAEGHLALTLADLEQVARGLHPRELDDGLPAALAALVERCPVPVELEVEAGYAPPVEVAAAAYYVCAEAFANVSKHSGASRVHLELTVHSGWLRVSVTDNGSGGADLSHGSGISGLVDRVEALSGTLTVSSPTGGGTRLVAELPLGHHAD